MTRPHIFDITISTPMSVDHKKRLFCACDGRVKMEIVDALLDIAEEYNKLQGLRGRVHTRGEGVSWEVRYARKQTELRVAFPMHGTGDLPESKKFSHSLEDKGRRHKIRVTPRIVEDGWTWDSKTRTLTHFSGKTEIVP